MPFSFVCIEELAVGEYCVPKAAELWCVGANRKTSIRYWEFVARGCLWVSPFKQFIAFCLEECLANSVRISQPHCYGVGLPCFSFLRSINVGVVHTLVTGGLRYCSAAIRASRGTRPAPIVIGPIPQTPTIR